MTFSSDNATAVPERPWYFFRQANALLKRAIRRTTQSDRASGARNRAGETLTTLSVCHVINVSLRHECHDHRVGKLYVSNCVTLVLSGTSGTHFLLRNGPNQRHLTLAITSKNIPVSAVHINVLSRVLLFFRYDDEPHPPDRSGRCQTARARRVPAQG